MSVTREDLGGNKVRLKITVPAEVFQQGIEKVYQKRHGQFVMPGFRKGNVPRVMIEKQYGPEIFYQDAFELVMPPSLMQAIAEEDLVVVSDPMNTKIDSWSRDNGVVYTTEIYVKPEVVLGPYEGLDVTEHVYKIQESDVDDAIENVRRQNVRWIPAERPAHEDDTVVIDFLGKLDGEPFSGGKAEHHRLLLGSHSMIDGFEDQIVGMSQGEDRTITVTFPEKYHAPELAGRKATFDIHVHSVEEAELPELDDDFAQDVSDFDTLDAFREAVRDDLQHSYDARSAAVLEGDILSQIVDASAMDVPPPMILRQEDEEINQFVTDLMRRGLTLEQYLQFAGITGEELRANLHSVAERTVRESAVLGALVTELGTQASDEEIDSELADIARQAKIELEEAKKSVSAEQRQALADRISVAKAMKELKELANVTVVEDESADVLFNLGQAAPRPDQTNENDETASTDSSEDTILETPEGQN